MECGALATLPKVAFTSEELTRIAEIGDNANCMSLKGANAEYVSDASPDRWPLNEELEAVATRWKIDPRRDLVHAVHAAETIP